MNDRLQRIASAASMVAMLLGVGGLVGWIFDIAVLKSVLPGLATMKPNTALLFVFTGVSLQLQISSELIGRRVWFAQVCALTTIAIATLTLSQYAFQIELGIDDLLLRVPANEQSMTAPGRMAPTTAVCFTLTGIALLLLIRTRRIFRSITQLCAVAVFVIAYLAVAGYAFDVSALLGVAGYTSMAIHTAVAFTVLSLGVLASRPDRGLIAIVAQDNSAGASARRILPAVLVIPFVVGWLRLKGEQLGFYGTEFGVALMVTGCTAILASFLLWHARTQGFADSSREAAMRDERFLSDLGELFRTSAESSELFAEVAKRLGEYLGVSRCLIARIDLQNQCATVERDYHGKLPSFAGTVPLSVYAPEAVAEAVAGRTAVSNDTRTDPSTAREYERAYRPANIRSHVSVPILRNGMWVSSFVVSADVPHVWQSREVSLVQAVAERTWLWFEHLSVLESLRHTEARKSAILSSALDAIVSIDHGGLIVDFNPAAERMFGYPCENAVGKPMADLLLAPPVSDAFRTGLTQYLQTSAGPLLGKVSEFSARRADGTEFLAELAVTRIEGESPPLFTGFIRDISERKRVEAEVRESEQRFRFFVESVKDYAIFLLKPDGTVATWNSGAERLKGYRADEIIGQHFSKFYPPEIAATGKPDRELETAARNGAYEDESWRVRKDGSRLWANVVITAIRDEKGELTGFGKVTRDMTERVRANEQFRLALEAAPTGMIMADEQGRIAMVNAQVETLFGYGREELIGTPVEKLVPERFRQRHPELQVSFRRERASRPVSARRNLIGLRKDGTEIPLEIGLNPLHTPNGNFVLSSVVDITERKHAERERENLLAELRNLNSGLEERVRNRTAELTATLREREVLLQEIHHRVKNNLQVISSLINMQMRQMRDESARAALDECRTRVEAIALIHEKLYQSKDYASVPFSQYVSDLATNVFHTSGIVAGKIALQLDIKDISLGVDTAIPCALIVNELITNAIKHAFPAERRGAIRIELKNADGRLCLTVKDDGVGLPRDFDLAKSKSLGLQLVGTLVEQLSGQLEIVRDNGTAFHITFPMGA